MDQGLEDAIDAGFGYLRLALDILKRDRSMILLQQLEHVERLGEDGNQIQPFDLCLGQSLVSRCGFPSMEGYAPE
jgi:hypothetical protein